MLYTIIVKSQPPYDFANEYISEKVFTDTELGTLRKRVLAYCAELEYGYGTVSWFDDPYPHQTLVCQDKQCNWGDIPF